RDLFLMYNLDGQYPLDRVKVAVDKIENYLYDHQEELEIRAVYSYYDESGTAQSSILLTDDSEALRASSDIANQILEELPDIAIGKPSFEFESSGSEGVSVALVGTSSEQLRVLAGDVIRILERVEGLNGVRKPETPNERELQIRVDRERARLLGFDSARVATTVATALRGINLREFQGDDGDVPVILRFRDADAQTPESLSGLLLTNDAGQQVPITAMVDLVENPGPNQIRRTNRETSLTIRANMDDITMTEASERIRAALEPLQLPPGYEWRLGRGFDIEDGVGQRMLINILLALVLIYIVLAALFESMLYPVTMIVSILFSVVGVYWFFMITGTTFSLMAMIGILILIGVVVNNGIVLIDHINRLRADGMERDAAIFQAGRDRLRPILMTVGTTVLGLVPLCIGTTQIGGNGPPYFPMARAIVGGLLFSTVVSLIFLPTIYMWLDVVRHWPRRVWQFLAQLGGRILRRSARAT
ncbi:MAG: efflux RND transporter permease subunit, partial [Wenzhouxiangellaceae bacterium]